MAKANITFVLAAVVCCFIENAIAQAIGNNCGKPNGFIGNGLNINNGLNNGNVGNFGQAGINNIGSPAVSNTAYGDVAIVGELPVGGCTALSGNVPVIGYVTFEGTVPAGGIVSVAAGCDCNGEFVNYLA